MTQFDREVSLHQAAIHLRVFWRTITKWIDSGKIRGVSGEGPSRKISLDSFNAFCRENGFTEYVMKGEDDAAAAQE